MLLCFLLSVNNTATSAENRGKNGYFLPSSPLADANIRIFLFPAVYLRLKLTDAASSSCLYQRSSLKPTTFLPLGRCPFST